MPHSQEDLNRLAQYGNSQQDSRAASTNMGGVLSGLPEPIKAHIETQARDRRLQGEAHARRMAAIPASVHRQVDREIRDDMWRFFRNFVLAPVALFIGIIWLGKLGTPDYSHIDPLAISKIEPDPALHAPMNPRVQELSRLSVVEMVRNSGDLRALKRGETPSQEQLDYGQALWLSHIANPNASFQADDGVRTFAFSLVEGYLTHRAMESGNDQFFIELGNDAYRLHPGAMRSSLRWQKLSLSHPDVPVLHAMADFSGDSIEVEYAFFRGLYYILSFVGLDDKARNFFG